ncbi:MAG: glycosyltransferase family 1 protein [bacterium]|nr:glycosyltransferase family 1 protein [bacterium]
MRIGIDARMISMSGIGTYLRNLTGGLAQIGGRHKFVLLLRHSDRGDLPALSSNFTIEEVEAAPYSLAEQFQVMRAVSRLKLDLIHHPHYAAPLFGGTPMVATIHDLIHQIFPEHCPSRLAWRMSWLLARRTASRARLILTVSEHSRRDILTHLGVPPEKVRLTYNCLPLGWGEGEPALPLPVLALGERPYFLHVGNHKIHKNLSLLLEAFSRLAPREKGIRLVLTGERGELEADLSRLHLEGDEVVFLGDLPNSALADVYRKAVALVFPSQYEGFGYPPLEAMGCGTPPIVSDAASLPEVVGDAGLIVPVGEVAPLAEAMERILSDVELRRRLSERAAERVRAFSWRNLAEKTLKAYEDAADIPG